VSPTRGRRRSGFLVDLRAAGPDIRRWFDYPQVTRQIGAVFQGEQAMTAKQAFGLHYDALLFVGRTTPARPVPGGNGEKRRKPASY
jgi:hypothetical protein